MGFPIKSGMTVFHSSSFPRFLFVIPAILYHVIPAEAGIFLCCRFYEIPDQAGNDGGTSMRFPIRSGMTEGRLWDSRSGSGMTVFHSSSS